MTDLRQAAQQALEALEGWEHCKDWVWPVSALEQATRNTTESLAALRTALAMHQVSDFAQAQEQQAEPSQWRDMMVVSLVREGINKHRARELADHFAAQQQVEPAAYLCENAVGHKYFRWKKPSGTYKPIALYTTPPQRKELSEIQILDMMPSQIPSEYDGPLMEFARAIEAKLKERNGY